MRGFGPLNRNWEKYKAGQHATSPRTLTTGAPRSWQQDLYGATVGIPAVASHFSAAALHGFERLTPAPALPEILTLHDAPVSAANALVRRTRLLPRNDVTTIEHVRCTSLARTACDLAAILDEQQKIRITSAVRHGSPV